jgi:hypothetical protein
MATIEEPWGRREQLTEAEGRREPQLYFDSDYLPESEAAAFQGASGVLLFASSLST